MSNSDDKLYNLVKFYESKIKPFKYTYNCRFGITIDLVIEPEEICHLLFGYLKGKNIPNASNYKGLNGYNLILDKTVTEAPLQVRKASKIKTDAFIYLPDLLANPDIIVFNPKIAGKGNGSFSHLETTDINGDFLFYKKIDNKQVHLFIKWDTRKKRYVALSLFHNKKDSYIENQILLNSSNRAIITERDDN